MFRCSLKNKLSFVKSRLAFRICSSKPLQCICLCDDMFDVVLVSDEVVLSRMLTLSSIGIWLCPSKRLLLHNEISKDKNVFHVHTYNECTKYTAPINKHKSCNAFVRRVEYGLSIISLRFVASVNETPSLFNENFSHQIPKIFLLFVRFLFLCSEMTIERRPDTLDSLGSQYERKKLTKIIKCILSYHNITIIRSHPIRIKKVQCALPTTATVSSSTIKQILLIYCNKLTVGPLGRRSNMDHDRCIKIFWFPKYRLENKGENTLHNIRYNSYYHYLFLFYRQDMRNIYMSREMTNSSGFPQLSKTTSDLSIYWGNELYTSHKSRI
ncbi:hypothetical protein AGLY_011636 [Aphis glycines]|uniref:Uncharacterized protein n=1 Tax=Aphis glycines TaxID=307491 RepID=A0A6G0TCZ4_APHGL|nr:hypothetical protein AGLY_011636 [Aphis glycines]